MPTTLTIHCYACHANIADTGEGIRTAVRAHIATAAHHAAYRLRILRSTRRPGKRTAA